ncbi:MAG: UV DNA damage repair endonuclease UvsE, partial [Deltaproteobacteria bacterium]|nr:UV DNA damage repair endonuclease UvsE [Deltaproteobacteria bacterium]
MARLGLCCTFRDAPIKFRTTTARYVSTLARAARPRFLNELAMHNADALAQAITWCAGHGIGAFRVNSGVLPMYTHPTVGWKLDSATGRGVAAALQRAGALARAAEIRLSFHPDQFVVPGSLTPRVVDASLTELEYMGEVATLIGAEQLTIHG